ncbi:hypothetical protein GCM10022419_025270 [Nonomuraea rosea]|uniref:Uncharacterized protein n=1 Tax=Nonomuraea rosea TaxID=638574 RepID=A0ABP6W103_9ACTN
MVDGRELQTANGFAYHALTGPLEVTVTVRPAPYAWGSKIVSTYR